MARQQAARPVAADVPTNGPSTTTTAAPSGSSTLILFNPALAVRAIEFHMIDEGLCNRVADDSLRASATRLRRASVCPQIEQSLWAAMTNAQRLEWLLQQTRTAARLSGDDEMAVLEPADV